MPAVTVFRRRTYISAQKPLLTILKQIKQGMYQRIIKELRQKVAQGKERRAQYLREILPGFTPSGSFLDGRQLNHLKAYTNYIQTALIELKRPDLFKYKMAVMKLPYTYACFENANGNGLIVLTRVDIDPRYHQQAFEEIRRFYTLRLSVRTSDQGQHITHLCTYTYDPELFLQSNASIYPFQIDPDNPPPKISNLEYALSKMNLKIRQ